MSEFTYWLALRTFRGVPVKKATWMFFEFYSSPRDPSMAIPTPLLPNSMLSHFIAQKSGLHCPQLNLAAMFEPLLVKLADFIFLYNTKSFQNTINVCILEGFKYAIRVILPINFFTRHCVLGVEVPPFPSTKIGFGD